MLLTAEKRAAAVKALTEAKVDGFVQKSEFQGRRSYNVYVPDIGTFYVSDAGSVAYENANTEVDAHIAHAAIDKVVTTKKEVSC